VAKRAKDLSEKLAGEQKPTAGWLDQVGIGQPEPDATEKDSARAGVYKRKTFLITDEIEERVRLLADREHVGQNELVRYLLTWSLSQIESGKHRLPAEPVEKRTLGV
jgi:hypothetical protein